MAYRIPDYIQDGIRRHVDDRVPTGSFLRACFSNDLTNAVCRADENSLACIVDIVKYIYNETPSLCHGSPRRVERWLSGTEMEEEDEQLLGV